MPDNDAIPTEWIYDFAEVESGISSDTPFVPDPGLVEQPTPFWESFRQTAGNVLEKGAEWGTRLYSAYQTGRSTASQRGVDAGAYLFKAPAPQSPVQRNFTPSQIVPLPQQRVVTGRGGQGFFGGVSPLLLLAGGAVLIFAMRR